MGHHSREDLISLFDGPKHFEPNLHSQALEVPTQGWGRSILRVEFGVHDDKPITLTTGVAAALEHALIMAGQTIYRPSGRSLDAIIQR